MYVAPSGWAEANVILYTPVATCEHELTAVYPIVLDIVPVALTIPAEKKKEFAVSFPVIAVPLESTRTLLVDTPPLREFPSPRHW